MLSALNNFYHQKDEPVKSCLFALRTYILNYNNNITEAWKYGMPFFCFKGKMFCYLWTHKKTLKPYIGMVNGNKIDHPLLIQEKRARMKIMFIDPNKDIPVKVIDAIFKKAMLLV